MEIYWICAIITIYCMTLAACQEHSHEHNTTASTLPCEFTGLGGTWLGPTGNNIRIMSDDGHRWFDSSDDFECLQRAEQFYILKADGGEQQSILMCVCINQTADDIINVQYLTSGDQRARVVPADAAVDSDELCNRDPNPEEFNVYMRSSDPSTIPSIQCPTCIQGVWGMIQNPADMCQYGSSLDACDLHHEFTVNSWMSANVTNNQCGNMDNSTERTLSCSHYVKTENATYTLARDGDGQFYCLITQNADNGMRRLNWVQRDNVAARMPDCMPTNSNTYPYYQLQTDGHCSGFGGTSGSRNTHSALSLMKILFVMTLYIAV